MNIRTAVTVFFILLTGLVLFSTTDVFGLLEQSIERQEELLKIEDSASLYQDIHQGMEEILLLQGDATLIHANLQKVELLEQSLNDLKLLDSKGFPVTVAMTLKQWKRYRMLLEELFQLEQVASDNDMALVLFIELVEVNELIERQFSTLHSVAHQHQNTYFDQIRRQVLISAVVVILLVVAILGYLYVRIIPALSRLSSTMLKVSESGDLSLAQRLDIGTDEFGVLASSFQQLVESLQHSGEALNERLTENIAILETIEEGLLVVDGNRQIVKANPAINQLSGIKPLVGRELDCLFPDLPLPKVEVMLRSFGRAVQQCYGEDRKEFFRLINEAELPLLLVELEHPDQRIVVASDTFGQLLGYSSEELEASSLRALTTADEWQPWTVHLQYNPEAMTLQRQARLMLLDQQHQWMEFSVAYLILQSENRPLLLLQLETTRKMGWEQIEQGEFGRMCATFHRVQCKSMSGFSIRREDDDRVPVNLSVASIYRQQGIRHLFMGTLLVVRDIHEILSAEQILRSNQAKDEFIASMSHELRTPLTAIIGNSELLAGSVSDPEQQKMLHSITVSGRNQLALVNDILDMSKIESGKFTINRAPFDLALVVGDIYELFANRIRDAGLAFEVDQQVMPAYKLIGDHQRIQQVLINLIGNSIKFTEEGGITLVVYRSGHWLHIQVKDTGIGMSQAVQERLFQRFEQADSTVAHRFGGTGLGLYISGSLASMMGGGIDVTSMEGVGTTFQLNLPYQESEEKVSEELATPPPEISVNHQFQGSVLLAEDTEELQLLFIRLLESMGLTVTAVENGEEAVQAVKKQSFDLILMDMQMPVMDGIEAAGILQRTGCTTPVVALTANVMPRHRELFREVGACDFLEKPVDHEALWRTLNRHLEQSETTISVKPDEIIDDELIAIFIEDIAAHRDALIDDIHAEQWDQVRHRAHKIKGTGSSFGFPALSDTGRAVTETIDRGDVQQAPKVAQQLVEEINRVLS